MNGRLRCHSVAVVAALTALAGCQCSTDYGTRCNFRRADGGTVVYGDVAPGTDLIDTAATECAKEVCFRQADAGLGPAADPVVGYCTGDCVSAAECPSTSGGAAGECVEAVVSGVPGIPQGVKYCTYPIAP